ncbi:phage tail tape measure protein [Clostridium saccharoperbutylacetonicum]|uniref:phage tail tape measure protein n=1 Tax=Clostridium saccharoperbutylacetonicum TaxID=36745 RepID=UPI0039E9DBD5
MADSEQLLITLGIKDSGTTKQISAINREIKALDKEFKSASAVSKEFEKSTEGLKTKLSYLEKSYTANNIKLDAYKKKVQETNEAITKKQAELEKLNSAEEVNQKAVNKANEQLEKMKNTLRTTTQNITLTENEMKRLTNEVNNTNSALKNEALNKYRQQMQELGDHIQGAGGKIKNAGENISGVGTKLLGLSAPLVAVSAMAMKVGMDFDSQMSRVKAISGATAQEFKQLEKASIDLGASTAFSSIEVAKAQENMASAGFKVNEILSATPGVLDLAASSGEDLATSATIASGAIRGFGLDASQAGHVADVLAKASADTNAGVASMGEAFKYVAPLARGVGWDIESVASAVGAMADANIDGSTSGTTLRGVISRLANPSNESAKAMEKLKFNAFDASGKMKPLSTITDELTKSMNGLTDEQKQANISTIFGQEAMSGLMVLMQKGKLALDAMADGLRHSDGSAKAMAETMQDNAKSAVEQMFGSMESAGIKLEQTFAPTIRKVADSVGELADEFSKLSPETQESILKMIGLTVATGGVLTVTGKVVSGVGSMVTGFGKLTSGLGLNATKVGSLTSGFEGLYGISLPLAGVIAGVGTAIYAYTEEQEAMSKSVVTSKEDLGLLKTTLLELNGVHVQSKKELEDAGLAYKDFGENIGDDFKTKVNEYTKAISDFNYYLGTINMDGVLTSEETTGFTSRVDTMFNIAIESIKGKQSTTQAEMAKMFTLGDGTLDQSEQQVLDYLNKNYTTNIEEVTKLKNDVNTIYKQAVDEKRPLNEQEIKDVQDKTAKIKQIELESLANNEQEQLYAKNEFINRVKQVDAKGAEELLLAQKQTLDKQNAQTLASYDTQIETMKIAREKAEAEGDTANKDNLDKQITAKTEERDKIIEKQRETWDGCIKVVEEMNPQLNGKINEYTGELLTNADLNAQKGIASLNKYYEGMNEVTTTGWYRMKNTTTGSMDDIYVSVDTNTGKINGAWNETTGVVGGYTDDIKTKVKELGQAHESEKLTISNALGAIAGSSVNTKDQMVNAMGEVVGQLENVTTASDGTRTGFINLNGTPIEITTNADGTITSMHEVKSSVEEIPKEKSVTISFWQKGLDAIKKMWNSIGNKDVGVDENETGTYSYNGIGLSTIDENGWELASNSNVSLLGAYYENSLASIPSGTSIRTHMQSVSDMKNEVRKQVNSLLANKNLNNNATEIDYNKLANVMLNAITQGLSNVNTYVNVEVDANGIVNKSVTKTMDKINRADRNNRISKGRG